jgi:hypothetical protein
MCYKVIMCLSSIPLTFPVELFLIVSNRGVTVYEKYQCESYQVLLENLLEGKKESNKKTHLNRP